MASAAKLQTRNVALRKLCGHHPMELSIAGHCCAAKTELAARARMFASDRAFLCSWPANRSARKCKTTLESSRWLASRKIEELAWRATAREVLKNSQQCEGFAARS